METLGISASRDKRGLKKIEENQQRDVLQAGQKQGPCSVSLNGKEAREHTGGRAPGTERGHQARRERGRFPASNARGGKLPTGNAPRSSKALGWAELGVWNRAKLSPELPWLWDTALAGAAALSTWLCHQLCHSCSQRSRAELQCPEGAELALLCSDSQGWALSQPLHCPSFLCP